MSDASSDAASLFDQGFSAHCSGRLDEAERCYKTLLSVDPLHTNAHRLLGLLFLQHGKHDKAISSLTKAVGLSPNDSVALSDLAHAQRISGFYDEALASISQAAILDPDSGLIHFRRGMILNSLRRYSEAEDSLRKAQDLPPEIKDISLHLGNALLSQGKYGDATVSFMAAIKHEPKNATAWTNCGISLAALGQDVQALDSFNQALELDPKHKTARTHRAKLYIKAGNHIRALSDMNILAAHYKDDADVLYNRGTMLAKLDMLERAIQDFKHALDLSPHDNEIRANYARTLIELDMLDEARDILEIGLQKDEKNGELRNLLGAAFNGFGKLDESLKHLQQAYAYTPDNLDTLHNLGLTYDDMGRPADAISIYNEALKLSPNNPDILLCRSLSHMMMGNFATAGKDFQARTRRQRHAVAIRHNDLPIWDGKDLGDTPLVIHAEQGYGDTLQFSRFISLARQRTRHIVVEAPAPLLRLLKNLPDIDTVTDNAYGLAEVQCPLPDLPFVLGLGEATIAPVTAYLSAPQDVMIQWSEKIAASKQSKIGIAWQGRKETRRAPHLIRGIPLKDMLAALPQDALLYPLQKDITDQDKEILSADNRVQDFTSDIRDFADSAAIAENMDLIVSIDTSPAHLALALAKPTYVLLPYSADWRWMTSPDTTPWYPTGTLLRQTIPGDWNAPLKRLSESFN